MRRTMRSLLLLIVVFACVYAGIVLSITAVGDFGGTSEAAKCSTTSCSATLRCCAPYACHRGRCLID